MPRMRDVECQCPEVTTWIAQEDEGEEEECGHARVVPISVWVYDRFLICGGLLRDEWPGLLVMAGLVVMILHEPTLALWAYNLYHRRAPPPPPLSHSSLGTMLRITYCTRGRRPTQPRARLVFAAVAERCQWRYHCARGSGILRSWSHQRGDRAASEYATILLTLYQHAARERQPLFPHVRIKGPARRTAV